MKHIIKKNIREMALSTLLVLQTFYGFTQKPDLIKPGSLSIQTELLHTGNFVWEQQVSDIMNFSGKPIIPNKFFVSINRTAKEIIIEERINNSKYDLIKRKYVLNAKTFEPIRAQSETEKFSYHVEFGSKIKGELENFITGNKEKYDELIEKKFFVGGSLEILISILPLKEGYKAFIPQVTFDQGYRTKVMRWEIERVQELKTYSCRTGEIIDVFLVEFNNTMVPLSNNHKIVVDKKTRRILSVVGDFGNAGRAYQDTQEDINPIQNKFNVHEAKAMISQGDAKIKGKAYTVDESKPRTIIESLKSRDKILAPKGSIVMLIPNTPYFKEWSEFNLSIQNKFPGKLVRGQVISGCGPFPLPIEVKEQTLITEVIDDKGSFSFQNLKPGEYYLTVQFVATKYTHTTRTPNGSYNITINSDGTGSASQRIDVTQWASPTNVMNTKLVRIKKDGEEVKIDLD